MTEKSVVRGDATWTVRSVPGSGEITYTITNATGSAQRTVDVDTAQEMRLLEAAAINTAHGQQP